MSSQDFNDSRTPQDRVSARILYERRRPIATDRSAMDCDWGVARFTRCCASRISASRKSNQPFYFATASRASFSSFQLGAYLRVSLYLASAALD